MVPPTGGSVWDPVRRCFGEVVDDEPSRDGGLPGRAAAEEPALRKLLPPCMRNASSCKNWQSQLSAC